MKLSQVAVQLHTVRKFTQDAATFAAGGCEWFIIEQDDTPGDPFVSLQQSFNYIKEHLVN